MLILICQPFLSLAIIQLRALSLLQKTIQNRDKLFLYTDPVTYYETGNDMVCLPSLHCEKLLQNLPRLTEKFNHGLNIYKDTKPFMSSFLVF
jgi:hypothetical protein